MFGGVVVGVVQWQLLVELGGGLLSLSCFALVSSRWRMLLGVADFGLTALRRSSGGGISRWGGRCFTGLGCSLMGRGSNRVVAGFDCLLVGDMVRWRGGYSLRSFSAVVAWRLWLIEGGRPSLKLGFFF